MLGLLALAAAATGYGTPNFNAITDGPPPVRYQQNAAALVDFTTEAVIAWECGDALRPDYLGCTVASGEIFITNPCLVHESYAQTLCHELAHRNGWPRNHPR